MFCLLLLGLALSAEQAAPSQLQGPDFSQLSGTWKGTITLVQEGECRLKTGRKFRHSTTVLLDVAPDGTFTGRPSTGADKNRWSGRFDIDLALTATLATEADCEHQIRKYEIPFSGRAAARDGRFELTMEGTDAPCPPQCVFKRVYELRKK